MAHHFAQVTLHLYDDFPPSTGTPAPARFINDHARPGAAGAIKGWWIPQTVADQIWVFAEFRDEAARDAYLATAREAIAQHVTSSYGKVASSAKVPDPAEVAHWCT